MFDKLYASYNKMVEITEQMLLQLRNKKYGTCED